MHAACVIGRHQNQDGQVTGRCNFNPILNLQVYDVMFPNGAIQQYAANVIAKNMLSQVDAEGHCYQLLDAIIDHQKDGHAVAIADGMITTKSGKRKPRITMRRWEFLVTWKDGTESWVKLKELKESFPVKLAEYAEARELLEQPAFAWWTKYTLRK